MVAVLPVAPGPGQMDRALHRDSAGGAGPAWGEKTPGDVPGLRRRLHRDPGRDRRPWPRSLPRRRGRGAGAGALPERAPGLGGGARDPVRASTLGPADTPRTAAPESVLKRASAWGAPLDAAERTTNNTVSHQNSSGPAGCANKSPMPRCKTWQGNDHCLRFAPCLEPFFAATRLAMAMSTGPSAVTGGSFARGGALHSLHG